ncbi:MAG: hypothetical protein AAGG68_07805 [Bacteroidota bacterium]
MKTLLTILLLTSTFLLLAQNDICQDTDCPTALFSISTTGDIQQAYLQFQQLKNSYAKDAAWQSKRDASQIGGQSCLRHYQLESFFASEYVKNKAFRQFVDQQGGGNDYVENGFENSRKGINLKKRMEMSCPSEVKAVEKQQEVDLDNLPSEYQQLGKELGYFDEQGNPTEAFVQKEKERETKEQPAKKKVRKSK